MIRSKREFVVVGNSTREATQHQVASAGKVPTVRTDRRYPFVRDCQRSE
jgi:hypothetical protein